MGEEGGGFAGRLSDPPYGLSMSCPEPLRAYGITVVKFRENFSLDTLYFGPGSYSRWPEKEVEENVL